MNAVGGIFGGSQNNVRFKIMLFYMRKIIMNYEKNYN